MADVAMMLKLVERIERISWDLAKVEQDLRAIVNAVKLLAKEGT